MTVALELHGVPPFERLSAYTGQPVEEDAPTNFAGKGSGVAMPPDAMICSK